MDAAASLVIGQLRRAPMKKQKIELVCGSGNFFRDLGYPNAAVA